MTTNIYHFLYKYILDIIFFAYIVGTFMLCGKLPQNKWYEISETHSKPLNILNGKASFLQKRNMDTRPTSKRTGETLIP